MTTTTFQHGYAGYRTHGCRCNVCGLAVSDYEQNRKRQITAGTWQPFVAAGPVREHLAALSAAGIGYKRVSQLAGVGRSTLGHLLFGRRGQPPAGRVRQSVADRILAVEAGAQAAAGANVGGVGTARRIRALCCIGWSLTYQAERLGRSVGNFAALVDAVHVVGSTLAAVSGLYEELSMTPAPAGYSATRARRFAVGHCWFPPLAWDDDEIDDPAAFPSVLPPLEGERPHPQELVIQHLAAGHPVDRPDGVLEEMVRRLSAGGYTAAQAAVMAQTTPKTISMYRSQLGLTRVAA